MNLGQVMNDPVTLNRHRKPRHIKNQHSALPLESPNDLAIDGSPILG